MTPANDFASRAARLTKPATKKAAPPQTGEDAAAPTPAPAVTAVRRSVPRSKPVRVSADLPPQTYRALVNYCTDSAEQIGRTKVSHVEVLRALVAELDKNADLRRIITDRLAQST